MVFEICMYKIELINLLDCSMPFVNMYELYETRLII